MALLDKLMFWKKKEEDFGGDLNDLGGDLGNLDNIKPPFETNPNQGAGTQPQFNPSTFNQGGFPQQPSYPQSNVNDKDLQIISLKLDSLKSTLDSIDQRLRNVEKIAKIEMEKAKDGPAW